MYDHPNRSERYSIGADDFRNDFFKKHPPFENIVQPLITPRTRFHKQRQLRNLFNEVHIAPPGLETKVRTRPGYHLTLSPRYNRADSPHRRMLTMLGFRNSFTKTIAILVFKSGSRQSRDQRHTEVRVDCRVPLRRFRGK